MSRSVPMSSRALRLAVALAAALPAAFPSAGAQTFTFESVGGTGTYVAGAYAPYVFQGTAQVVLDGGIYGALGCTSSGVYCLYNGNAAQDVNLVRNDGGAFRIGSGVFTSWFGSTSATISGLLGGAPVFSSTFALTNAATLHDFGDVVVDELRFRGNGYFLADDIVVSSVVTSTAPEPGSIALLATGLAGVAAVVRRRRR